MPSSHAAPPDTLDEPLELTPGDWPAREVYLLVTGLVVPRPIGWISTVGDDGVRNVAPHSFFNIVASQPPHVMFSTVGLKDTVRNTRTSGEFVVNVVTREVTEIMNATSADLPHGEDEFTWFGIEAAPARTVAAPRVAAARAHLECRVVHEVAVGNSFVVVGEVEHVHVAPEVWRGGRVDPELLDPLLRLAGTGYAEMGEVFKLPRPTWDEVRGADADARIPRR